MRQYRVDNADKIKVAARLRYEENKEYNREYKRKYTRENPEAIRNSKLKTNYGISLADYNELLSKQGGKCAICKEQDKLHVDHCHNSGSVRGLLCRSCNHGLGNFKDSITNFNEAINYLRNNNARL